MRLDRGGPEFIRSVANHFHDIGEEHVYSPALYLGASKVWRRAGFEPRHELVVMERSLSTRLEPVEGVEAADDPPWDDIHDLDNAAFSGFWTMSRLGLEEALGTNRTSTVLLTYANQRVVGYSLLGSQWGVTYLHRIAVHPSHAGQGHGRRLLQASIGWGRNTGGRTMLLNVRPDNASAISLYKRLGFVETTAQLAVFRHV